jgi:hypothetical protein
VLYGVKAREPVQEQAARVAGNRHEGAVVEAEDLLPGACVQAVDPVLAVAEVDDPVDDRGRSGCRRR